VFTFDAKNQDAQDIGVDIAEDVSGYHLLFAECNVLEKRVKQLGDFLGSLWQLERRRSGS
jgi:hypothetical protein